jgi:hypothetical protein
MFVLDIQPPKLIVGKRLTLFPFHTHWDREESVSNTLLTKDLVIWDSKTPCEQFIEFGPLNRDGVSVGTRDGTWRYCKTCIDVKQSREEHVDDRSIDFESDHNTPKIKSALIILGQIGNVWWPNK